MIATIKISEKGQIALPQAFRTLMGIKQGDNLVILHSNGKIILEKAENTRARLIDDFKDVLANNDESLKEVWANKEDDIWSQYIK